MLKHYYILFLVLFTYKPCFSQVGTVNYFMPDTLGVFHIYHLLTPDGQPTGIVRRIEYALVDDKIVVNEINSAGQNVMSTTLQHVELNDNQVLVTYSRKKNSMGMNQVRRYNPPAILLKVPKGKETISWIDKETGEKYTARFVTLNEDGENKKCLATYRVSGGATEAKYYYPGIGLWKTAMIKNGESTTMYKLTY